MVRVGSVAYTVPVKPVCSVMCREPSLETQLGSLESRGLDENQRDIINVQVHQPHANERPTEARHSPVHQRKGQEVEHGGGVQPTVQHDGGGFKLEHIAGQSGMT
ncbi:hypothetical protein EYF80_051860 [Liparis tanakae]|uniref:Uncharacterized protein n=1 Tax=Liparis tanakae TaxID=230148 RepID=A0A4Z2FAS2_9TELE|nr:hypothetical protein EYF80_051860 [Liparis tanakae]